MKAAPNGRRRGFPRPASVRRRVAVASWRPSRDGRIYTRAVIDAAPMLAYLEQTRARTGQRVTVTHVIGAALGRAIRAEPRVRARVVFGRVYEFDGCDIAFAVDIDGGDDLAPVKVRDADQKSPASIAAELSSAVHRLRSGKDAGHSLTSGLVRALPVWALRPLFAGAGVMVGGLGIGMLGQQGYPLGAAFVSNVGSLGLDEAFLAPLPLARVPLYLAVGAVHDAPLVVDGEIVVRPQVVLVATADHRLVDGAHAGRIARVLRVLLADPSQLDRA